MSANTKHRPKSLDKCYVFNVAGSFSQLAVGSESTPTGPIRIQFQIGLLKEGVLIPEGHLTLQDAKCLAEEIIERKAPDCSVKGLGEKLLLFRHEPDTEQILHRLTDQHHIRDGDLLEVVISGTASVAETKYRPHSLVVQSYRTPTFCHYCGEMLWGLVRQGLKCEGCGLDFHKRCAFRLPNDCSRVYRRCGPSLSLFPPGRPRALTFSSHTGGSLEEISMSKPSRSRPPSWADVPVSVGVCEGKDGRPRVPHTFHIHTYTKLTICQYCFRLLKGLFRQGMQCSDCKFNCHRRCEPLVPPECRADKVNGEEPEVPNKESELDVAVVSVNSLYEELRYKEPPTEELKPLQPATPCFSSNIPLMRVYQSVKHCKRRSSGVLRKGWLMHHTSTDALRKRHYWELDGKTITLYPEENSNKYYKEIPLSEVLHVRGLDQLTVPVLPDNGEHSFELVTSSLVYCVFADQEGPCWESALKLALRPVQGTKLDTTDTTGQGQHNKETQDISEYYQIFSDEVLGSGQFGVVYSGTHRQSGRPVAIKVIDKTRFPSKQEEQTKIEVTILQKLSHPGVINLEGMFETSQHTFVVMEKLHSDMLEMILSHENGRLTERTTRFLAMQVLEALRYLHMKNIAHCDLKPENVLLASPDPFSQVKLCDFGFARIIGEKSFRRTVVGTPAYLAPEVIKKHGYNRSLDMWAAGVILYVSLSGTFPFNEDEDINQQITNASFMYPRQPWSLISLEGKRNNAWNVDTDLRASHAFHLKYTFLMFFSVIFLAVNLINNLLQVVVRRRFSVGKAMGHPWFQNFQLWCDLREFEQRMGYRYLTHEAEAKHWRSHAQERGLSFPEHLAETESEEKEELIAT
ncbi:protein kinase D4 isoform X2 [Triplophysa rosa]|uniref:protein kinase D4 isoform X2 n=1 Tax=Triplophysa rosa TaxID=992332 RepID=UPI002545D059|nr:protein kinase D4 isoform X2 [Triplophysa rosa]